MFRPLLKKKKIRKRKDKKETKGETKEKGGETKKKENLPVSLPSSP